MQRHSTLKTDPVLTLSDLIQMGTHLPNHGIRGLRRDAPMLSGKMSLADAATGIHIHTSDVTELEDFEVSFEAAPALKLMVQVGGETRCQIGDRKVVLNAANGPVAAVFAFSDPITIIRRASAGTSVRKVVLTLSADWFKAAGDGDTFRRLCGLKATGDSGQWTPGVSFETHANRLIALRSDPDAVNTFEQNRLAFALMEEAVQRLESLAHAPQGDAAAQRRMEAATAFIAANLQPGLTVAQIARAVGTSPRVLERTARQVCGKTIGEIRRDIGLRVAHDALSLRGVTVAQAAHLAGYSNPSSFTVAFQRSFNVSPSALRGLVDPSPSDV
ncbi:MAG: helix-turn-helix transcriptional regulator [Pseudomonadota bacterium]